MSCEVRQTTVNRPALTLRVLLQTKAVNTYVVRIVPKVQLRAIPREDRLKWLADHAGGAAQGSQVSKPSCWSE